MTEAVAFSTARDSALEPAFMVSAVRHFVDPHAPAPDARGVNWTELIRLADAHAVIPALHAVLNERPIPSDGLAALRSAMEDSVRRSMAHTAELARVSAMLAQTGIPVIALKGPMLSQYLYGDPASRSSGDIDLLGRYENLDGIREALASQGYRLRTAVPGNSSSDDLRSRESQLSFVSSAGLVVDIHWRLFPSYYASAFDCIDPWQHLASATIGGRELPTLAPDANLLFLCSHGAKHMFARLGWVCDIAQFLKVARNLDWPALVEAARQAGALRQLLLGVRLAVDVLGAPAPEKLPVDPTLNELATIVRKRLLAGAVPPAPALESTRFCLRLFERRSHRLRLLNGLYITPSAAEYKTLRLPPALHGLYYPMRSARLLWKLLAVQLRQLRHSS